MANYRFYLLMGVLFIALFFLQYRLWFEAGSVRDMIRLKQMLAQQMEENQRLKQRNKALLFQVQRLQNSKDAVESRARGELGMIKKGEVFYQVVK